MLQTYPTPQAAQQATIEQIEEKGHHSNPTAVALEIYKLFHQPELTAEEMMTWTKARLMQALVAQMLLLLKQIATYDKEITERFFDARRQPDF